jgi:1,4-dihydroxy-6-naphthoate synthase
MNKGLYKIVDLGNYWEEKTSLPIPLGGIVGKKNIDENILKQVDSLIRKSIEYSFSHYPFISDYIKKHSQEMEEEVMKKHIDLYVNDYTIDLGEKGKNAIEKFIEIYNKNHQIERPGEKNIFL